MKFVIAILFILLILGVIIVYVFQENKNDTSLELEKINKIRLNQTVKYQNNLEVTLSNLIIEAIANPETGSSSQSGLLIELDLKQNENQGKIFINTILDDNSSSEEAKWRGYKFSLVQADVQDNSIELIINKL